MPVTTKIGSQTYDRLTRRKGCRHPGRDVSSVTVMNRPEPESRSGLVEARLIEGEALLYPLDSSPAFDPNFFFVVNSEA